MFYSIFNAVLINIKKYLKRGITNSDDFLNNMNLLILILFLGFLVIILHELGWYIHPILESLFTYLALISLLGFSYNNSEIYNYGSNFGIYLGYCTS